MNGGRESAEGRESREREAREKAAQLRAMIQTKLGKLAAFIPKTFTAVGESPSAPSSAEDGAATPTRRARVRPKLGDLLRPSALVLVAANLVPLYGVLVLKWQVFPLIFLYWFENVVIGVFNVLRMLTATPGQVSAWVAKAFFVPFFCVHYGIFTMVHGLFVMVLFGGSGSQGAPFPGPTVVLSAIRTYQLSAPLLILVLSHGFSFVWNYLRRGEYMKASLPMLMGAPYSRVIVLHLTLIFGGFLIMALKSPVGGLVLLVVLKIVFDVAAHLREHSIGVGPQQVQDNT